MGPCTGMDGGGGQDEIILHQEERCLRNRENQKHELHESTKRESRVVGCLLSLMHIGGVSLDPCSMSINVHK